MARQEQLASWMALHEAESEEAPYGSVLQIGSVRILLDCGNDGNFSTSVTDRIAEIASSIDLVLLSHHDLRHVGALAVCVAKHGLKAPVFATLPCVKLGTMTLYEAWLGFRAARGRTAAVEQAGSLDDIDDAMQRIRPLKFEQPLELRGKGAGIVITAHRAGYSVGGAMWRIRTKGEDVVYCVDVRHAAERHAPAAAIDSIAVGQRPSVVITDARAIDRREPASRSRKAAEEALVDTCLERLRSGGNVLIPVDATTRLVEVALVLDEAWRERKLGGAYDLVLAHSMVRNVVELSRCQLEWMASSVQRAFHDATISKKASAAHPLALREARLATNLDDALGTNSEVPKCVLASRAELDYGASAAAARALVLDPSNLIISISRTFAGTDTIVDRPVLEWSRGIISPLHGEALVAYEEERRKQRADDERREARRRRALDFAADLAQMEGDDEAADVSDEEPRHKEDAVVEGAEEVEMSIREEARASLKRKRIETLMNNKWFKMPDEEKQKLHPILTWLAIHKPRPPSPPPDEYGQPIPEIVLEAIRNTKSSLLLGLETREGFSHLREDQVKSSGAEGDERGGLASANQQEETAAAKPKPLGDAAYDDGDEDEPFVWQRDVVRLEPKCRRIRIDGLDGLCDARSLKNTLATIRPRCVVVLPSPKASDLVKFLNEKLGASATAPEPRQPADLTAVLGRAPLLDADLSWTLVDRFNKCQSDLGDGLAVVRFHDVLLAPPNDSASRRRLVAPEDIDNDQELGELPDNPTSHIWLSSKDLVLPSLKDKLEASGIKADFKAGALVCAGNILVKKLDAVNKRQNIRIEGPLCPEYFLVAGVLKSAFTLV